MGPKSPTSQTYIISTIVQNQRPGREYLPGLHVQNINLCFIVFTKGPLYSFIDVGIMILQTAVKNVNFYPICLPRSNTKVFSDKTYATGWGVESPNNIKGSHPKKENIEKEIPIKKIKEKLVILDSNSNSTWK